MKTSLWFDASMLALILAASVIYAVSLGADAQRTPAEGQAGNDSGLREWVAREAS
jgi:hypothetical protein